MKGLLKFLIGGILGLAMGWGLGYIRVPIVEAGGSYWAGVATGVGLIGLLLGWALIWEMPGFLLRRLRQQPRPGFVATTWALLIVIVGGAACGWWMYRQRATLDRLAEEHDRKYLEHEAMVEAQRNSTQVQLMAGLLDEVRGFVREHPGDSLPQPYVDRIATLSQTFRPYRYFQGDSLSPTRLSPERGQLLASLAVIGLDSSSFARIKKVSDFSLADLRGMTLTGADLSGSHLRGANLSEANLRHANLRGADLQAAMLWAAEMDSANLSGANLRHANAQWAQMNGVKMVKGNLNGADMSFSQLGGSHLIGTTFRFARGESALIMGSDLTDVDMMGTKLNRANFKRSNLTGGHLRWAELSETRLDNATMDEMRVSFEDWSKIWTEWKASPDQRIESTYSLLPDSLKKYGASFKMSPKATH